MEPCIVKLCNRARMKEIWHHVEFHPLESFSINICRYNRVLSMSTGRLFRVYGPIFHHVAHQTPVTSACVPYPMVSHEQAPAAILSICVSMVTVWSDDRRCSWVLYHVFSWEMHISQHFFRSLFSPAWAFRTKIWRQRPNQRYSFWSSQLF